MYKKLIFAILKKIIAVKGFFLSKANTKENTFYRQDKCAGQVCRGGECMRLKEKFILLTVLSVLLVALVSIVGYFQASSNLEESVEEELMTTVEAQENNLEGWLTAKSQMKIFSRRRSFCERWSASDN